MKYLGVDYGTKRIGLAVSDDEGSMAFPYTVVPNRGIMHAADDIVMACRNKKIDAIVIGESLNYALEDNPIMKHIRTLAQHLKDKINLPIFYEDETLSSAHAERTQACPPSLRRPEQGRSRSGRGKNELLDASAAAIILNSFLEKQKNKK
ncbi:MAG: Holliday junction resolvase RuvX [Candidatus Paceibacterota bacterium]|jgi:putative Holliday junction resolvase